MTERSPVAAAADIRPQMDGLRTIAMVGVLYVHFWGGPALTEHLRVTLFFVVSGFLITHMLLTAKEKGGDLCLPCFYGRRALRLFPALVLVWVAAWMHDADGFRASALWHRLPTSNTYFARLQEVTPWVVGQLWSLNVLEQFYLLWPVAVVLLSLRGLYVLTFGPLATLIFPRANAENLGIDAWWLFMMVSADPILTGVLVYLLQRLPQVREVMLHPAAFVVAVGVILLPFALWEGFGASQSYRFLAEPAVAVFVAGAFQGFRGPVGWALCSPPMRYLSRLS